MAGRVEGKVAFITGAARGQGRAHAVRLAQEGADIIAVDICGPIEESKSIPSTPEDLAETVRQVEALDRRIIARQVDIRDLEGMTAVVAEGVSELGRLDVIVANAGITIMDTWDRITPAQWQTSIDVNLTGTWNTVMAGVHHLVAAGGGSIILVSSASGLKGSPFHVPYVASKHGVVGLMRAFAAELAKDNIRVNTLHPTGVNTLMGSGGMADALQYGAAENPRILGMYTNMLDIRMTEPEDQAHAVLFLASDESRYVTSLTMTVDAGVTSY
jgi:SDR family mycofactocin-dependent oxidoreductase